MAKIILGLAGEMASGKGTAARYIMEKYPCTEHRFSTALRDVLNRLYLEQTREHLSHLSTTLRKTFGEDLLAKVIFHDVQKDEKDLVVIDGVRRIDDIVHLRTLPHFKFVYIETDMRMRYERIIQRAENADDAGKTFEQFQQEHQLETELQIPKLKEIADFVLDNNGTTAELYRQVDAVIEKCKD